MILVKVYLESVEHCSAG